MRIDEAEVAIDAACLQALDEAVAHRADAVAHFAEFLDPGGIQFRRGQHRRDERTAMRRRVRVIGADHALELRQHARGFVLALGDDRQRADALAVQRERLRERRRHEHVQVRSGEQAHGGRIGFEAFAEALVGHVEERYELARLDHFDHPAPLRVRQVDAGRVVAAGVQHDDRAGRVAVQRVEHGVEVHAVRGRVVVRIDVDREVGHLEQRAVVFPARIADRDAGVRVQHAQEVGADLQRARAADCLRGHDAARRDQRGVVAEHLLLHGCVIGGDTVDRQVAARQAGLDPRLFRVAHRAQQRDLAFLVGIHADPEIHLGRARIGVECFVEAQDRIAGREFDSGEERHGDFAAVSSGMKSGSGSRASEDGRPRSLTPPRSPERIFLL
ncbi:hypothetical protein BGL_1c27300 [Burkholderia plantarii]|uniref:Uncharacterized protein n=1 Tax=Burkholderia plantarii TaxID=41899 RepID=A0A0B6RYH1_BURPL|nr:hypothetical protein BGL_1c27300 [Burkholderia plantarii]